MEGEVGQNLSRFEDYNPLDPAWALVDFKKHGTRTPILVTRTITMADKTKEGVQPIYLNKSHASGT